MNMLAINTSFNQTYVAVKVGPHTFFDTMDSKLKQAENVLGLVDKLLNKAQISVADLNTIACVIGPGSFTGIRIGASLVKGFCMAQKHIKKIQINSLDLLAYSFAKTKPTSDFWVALNALSGNIFVRKYNKDGEALTEPEMYFGEKIGSLSGIVVGLGEENLDFCTKYIDFSSEELLSFAEKLANENNFSQDFIPLYIRKSQAEAQLDEKNGNN